MSKFKKYLNKRINDLYDFIREIEIVFLLLITILNPSKTIPSLKLLLLNLSLLYSLNLHKQTTITHN